MLNVLKYKKLGVCLLEFKPNYHPLPKGEDKQDYVFVHISV